MLSDQLINPISDILDVSQFINDRLGNVFQTVRDNGQKLGSHSQRDLDGKILIPLDGHSIDGRSCFES